VARVVGGGSGGSICMRREIEFFVRSPPPPSIPTSNKAGNSCSKRDSKRNASSNANFAGARKEANSAKSRRPFSFFVFQLETASSASYNVFVLSAKKSAEEIKRERKREREKPFFLFSSLAAPWGK
jgi:hypothetical protein